MLLARQTREVNLLKTDPSYLETIARDRLDLMKEGETIFRLDSHASGSAGSRQRRVGPLPSACGRFADSVRALCIPFAHYGYRSSRKSSSRRT